MLRSCRFCGAPFETRRNAQKYCSRECVREAARRRDREYRRRKRQAAALAAGETRVDVGWTPALAARDGTEYTATAEPRGDYAGSAPKPRRGPRTNAERWALALEVMRETGKSYGQCQAEGLLDGKKGRKNAPGR